MKQPHKLMGWMSIGQMRVYLLGTEYSSKSVQRQKCNPLPGSQWPHQRLRELFSTNHRFPTDRPQLVHGRVEPSSSSLQAKKKHTRGNWQHQGALCFFSPNMCSRALQQNCSWHTPAAIPIFNQHTLACLEHVYTNIWIQITRML